MKKLNENLSDLLEISKIESIEEKQNEIVPVETGEEISNDAQFARQNIKGLISFEETYCIIKEIMEKAYKSSWSSKDYPISVVRIIEKCGHISGLAQLSSEELLRTLKKQHRDIEKEMIKEETIKKLSGGNNGN